MALRPINARERRAQFLRFLALFLLAVAPLVLLVYLHGRVDKEENTYLREEYDKLRGRESQRKEHRDQLLVMAEASDKLMNYVAHKRGDMMKFDRNEFSLLQVELDNAKKSNERFLKFVSEDQSVSDSVLLASAKHYQDACNMLLKVYEVAFSEVDNLKKKKDEWEKHKQTCPNMW